MNNRRQTGRTFPAFRRETYLPELKRFRTILGRFSRSTKAGEEYWFNQFHSLRFWREVANVGCRRKLISFRMVHFHRQENKRLSSSFSKCLYGSPYST